MTTRLKGVTVLFDADIREDDARAVLDAIRCLKHVLEVRPLEAGSDDWMVYGRARAELIGKLVDVLK